MRRAAALLVLIGSAALAQAPEAPPVPGDGLPAEAAPATEGAATGLPDLTGRRPTAATPQPEMPTRTIESNGDAPRYVIAPVLTVDQDRLFAGSAWGQRAQRDLEARGQQVAAENERLAEQLSAEEARLTEQRTTLAPEAFRKLAEDFDRRATGIRRERAQAVEQLNQSADADRTAFYQAALPVMGEMMQERGAVAVLDRRTVFVSLDAIDITADLIQRLDTTIGDRAATGPEPDPDDPATTSAETPAD